MRHGLTLTSLDVAIGLVAAVGVTQVLVAMLFDVSRLDAIADLGVTALLISIAAAACCLPALRAARLDPATVLRAESRRIIAPRQPRVTECAVALLAVGWGESCRRRIFQPTSPTYDDSDCLSIPPSTPSRTGLL